MSLFSPKKPNKPKLDETGQASLLDLIAPSGFKVSQNYIQIGEKFARTLFVFTYPRYLSTNWLAPVINLDESLDISIFIHPANSSQVLKNLTKKLAEVKSQMSLKEERGMVRDPMLETAHQDIETLRDSLQQGNERFFKLGLYVTIYANTLKELNKKEEKIISLF